MIRVVVPVLMLGAWIGFTVCAMLVAGRDAEQKSEIARLRKVVDETAKETPN